MDESTWLPERFEEERSRLRAVAYRMLGSSSEADDAVQEAWLRISRAGTDGVENLTAWLTTVVARVCLNMLRTRERRHEEPLDPWQSAEPRAAADGPADPEQEAVLADSVGLALLVVLDMLTPAERLAFVLHDMFAVPFDEIGPMIDRTPAAARQLASRARRRVKGGGATVPDADVARQRRVVEAYLAASREGDFEALVALLDPDVVLRADQGIHGTGPVVVHGARTIAEGARTGAARMLLCAPALVDGRVGLVLAPAGRLTLAIAFDYDPVLDRITGIDAISDPARLSSVDIAVLDD